MYASDSKLCKGTLDEAQLRGMLKQHDDNGDGHLNKEELKVAFKRLGAVIPRRADRAMYYTDIDIDGVISEDEIDHLVAFAVECGYTLD